jgi:hypothetical protein
MKPARDTTNCTTESRLLPSDEIQILCGNSPLGESEWFTSDWGESYRPAAKEIDVGVVLRSNRCCGLVSE